MDGLHARVRCDALHDRRLQVPLPGLAEEVPDRREVHAGHRRDSTAPHESWDSDNAIRLRGTLANVGGNVTRKRR